MVASCHDKYVLISWTNLSAQLETLSAFCSLFISFAFVFVFFISKLKGFEKNRTSLIYVATASLFMG